jgi:hypothetical protein
VVLETHTVAILVNDFTGVVDRGILVNNDRSRFEYVHKEHTEEYSYQQWQELEVIEKLHNSLLMVTEINRHQ